MISAARDAIRSVADTYRAQGLAATARAIWRRLFFDQAVVDAGSVNELALAAEALELAREPGVMIDVGAHYGTTARPFLRAGWRVLAFEPDPDNRKELERRLDGYDRLSIDPRAVSNRADDELRFYQSRQSSGISGLSAFHESHQSIGTVKTTTLRREMAATDITHVDVLKIDTEGFDKMVLEGFPWNIDRPRLVVCEFEDRKTVPLGYRYHDLITVLEQNGYRVILSEWEPIVEYGGRHRWAARHIAPFELRNEDAWGNLLALREEADFDKILNKFDEVASTLADESTGGQAG